METEPRITLAHGNGGRLMRELIEGCFAAHLGPGLDTEVDAAPVALPPGEVVVTTDGFVVQPLTFPGGDIGSLAVHGTVNDLAVAGADPVALTVAAVVEEGLPLAELEAIARSLAHAAAACGVAVVAGDTKVVGRGEGGGLYLTTTGVGVRPPEVRLGPARVRPGDRLLVSGSIGDHGTAVMLAREQFGLRGELASDSAPLLAPARALRALPGVRFLRDPTRGGLATVCHDLVRTTGLGVRLEEAAIPVRPQVASVCEMLGYDPYYLACEGRLVAAAAPEAAAAALDALRAAGCPEAAVIGTVVEGPPRVVLATPLGGERFLEELEDDPLPRIC
ncbi:MAG: hydrogenase expression/formation protein HypE [Nitrospirae bacterium]|nr:MAG: hydrogenase expression/formation protein HypE [Nitrospirota bacterium]